MSKYSMEKIACPVCNKKNEIKIWDSINVELNPEAKEGLLNGELFSFHCDKCGNSTNVFYPCLYNDQKHNVMVYLITEDMEENTVKMWELAEKQMEELMIPGTVFSIPEIKNVEKRIVFDIDRLREKALIFDNGLDDKIVEIIKLLHFAKLSFERPELNIQDIFFFVEDGKYKLELFGDKVFSMVIQDGFYEQVKEDYKDFLKNIEKSYVIDMDWANNFINNCED